MSLCDCDDGFLLFIGKRRLDGVWAEADVSSGRVTVRMKREIEDKVLKKTVNDIGAYTVMKVE